MYASHINKFMKCIDVMRVLLKADDLQKSYTSYIDFYHFLCRLKYINSLNITVRGKKPENNHQNFRKDIRNHFSSRSAFSRTLCARNASVQR